MATHRVNVDKAIVYRYRQESAKATAGSLNRDDEVTVKSVSSNGRLAEVDVPIKLDPDDPPVCVYMNTLTPLSTTPPPSGELHTLKGYDEAGNEVGVWDKVP